MSFAAHKTTIEEGDTVIIYLHANSMHAIDVHPEVKSKKDVLVENVFQTSFGALKVKSLIGMKYGSKVELSRGWAYALQPTPELWTQTLPHRTQIIYTPDISMILYQLDIRPGSVVVESGKFPFTIYNTIDTFFLNRNRRKHPHQVPAADRCRIISCGPSSHSATCTRSTFTSIAPSKHATNSAATACRTSSPFTIGTFAHWASRRNSMAQRMRSSSICPHRRSRLRMR